MSYYIIIIRILYFYFYFFHSILSERCSWWASVGVRRERRVTFFFSNSRTCACGVGQSTENEQSKIGRAMISHHYDNNNCFSMGQCSLMSQWADIQVQMPLKRKQCEKGTASIKNNSNEYWQYVIMIIIMRLIILITMIKIHGRHNSMDAFIFNLNTIKSIIIMCKM